MSGKSQTIGDFTFCSPSQILLIYRIIAKKSVPDSPDYEFGGKWKVCQKLKLEHKCNSITATWMHTTLCCSCTSQCKVFHSEKKKKPTKRRTKRFWIREYLKKREKYGQFHILFSELSLSDREYFFRYIQDESKML